MLYQIDLTKNTLDYVLNDFATDVTLDEADREFAHTLVTGVVNELDTIDQFLAVYAKDWKIDRMSYIDRNILRLAIYELTFLDDIPIKVSVNEAVELGKHFSDEKAAKFINGVLGSVVNILNEADKDKS